MSEWMDDGASICCLLCATNFSFTNRRHHCRKCLRLVCAACSGRGTVRTCDECWTGRRVRVTYVVQGNARIFLQKFPPYGTSKFETELDRFEANGGSLVVTSHRLVWGEISIPLASILDVNSRPEGDSIILDITERTYATHLILCPTLTNFEILWLTREIAWRTREDDFRHTSERERKRRALKAFLTTNTFAEVDLKKEFERQGLDQRWRLTTANANFGLCETYPSVLAVPAGVPDETLRDAARWRSKQRLPVLTYFYKGAPLCRSSQPLTGFGGTCPEDEILLSHIRQPSFDETDCHVVLRICDARPLLNAKANAALGKGHETISRLGKDCASLQFFGIPNIHVVNESFRVLREGLEEDLFRAVHESRWLHHISALLRGADVVAEHLRQGDPVLLHCSDGWDRTAQVAALAQFLLDPYFRTFDGFRVLIEKEFVSFGHMFCERSGVKQPIAQPWTQTPQPRNDTEISPIFMQFLDAICQLLAQFPTITEFDESLLKTLWEAQYSRFYKNFLRDSEKERKLAQDAGLSVWSLDFERNVLYEPTSEILRPHLKSLHLCAMYLPHDAPPPPAVVLKNHLRHLLAKLEDNGAIPRDHLVTS